MGKFLADVTLGPGFSGFGPLGKSGSTAPAQFNATISKIIGVMTVVSFVWFTFMVLIGAIRIVASGGDKASIESARKQITTGVVGVVIVVSAIFIVSLIGTILGVESFLNPTCVITGGC